MNELIGRSELAPMVFGNNAPDSGNAELLAIAFETVANDDLRKTWLDPLLAGVLRSAFCMTEPGAGSDPTLLATTAELVDGYWVVNGSKWFSSNASASDFLIVMAVTDPDAAPHERCSMILVPTTTPGVDVVRDIPTMDDPEPVFGALGNHSEVRFTEVRVPESSLLGHRGRGFELAQARLGPGRLHHCMRWVGQAQRALDMMCERAVSRRVSGGMLAEKQTVQNWIADSRAELAAMRLMTMHAAWTVDRFGAKAARDEIAMIKFFGAPLLHRILDRAIQVHGALGFSGDLPLEHMYRAARAAHLYDGPDEVHRVAVARRTLRAIAPVEVPSEHIPTRRAAAMSRYGLAAPETDGVR
ncbi:acyl-CoA dehydrogenase family protein [Streptomyces sp. NPDC001982]|uniref:acyl-CoA dehydrogenase family protein n=1 Tax=Streptomyces sp. NPDC001982 TaxID=3154405 RepID=UPI0033337BCB